MRWLPLLLLVACTDPADDYIGTWRVYSGEHQIGCPTLFHSQIDDGAVHVITRAREGDLQSDVGNCTVPLVIRDDGILDSYGPVDCLFGAPRVGPWHYRFAPATYTLLDKTELTGIMLEVDATLVVPSGYCHVLGQAFMMEQ